MNNKCYKGFQSILINKLIYDAPLDERASYLTLHSSLFGPDGAVNYDY